MPRSNKFEFTDQFVKHLPIPQYVSATDRKARLAKNPKLKIPPNERQIRERIRRGLTLILYVSYGGTKSWRVEKYDGGRPITKALGSYPKVSLANARSLAEAFDADKETAAQTTGTFKEVAQDWLHDHVIGTGLRSRKEIERQLTTYVYPRWEKKAFFDIDRDDVSELQRQIELDVAKRYKRRREEWNKRAKEAKARGVELTPLRDDPQRPGVTQSDAVFRTISSIMRWYLRTGPIAYSRVFPLVPKMSRDKRKTHERSRDRILNDPEIRALWEVCDGLGTYGALIKVLLLTGQRKQDVARMKWTDLADGVEAMDSLRRPIKADNVWTIPDRARDEKTASGKGNARALKLPDVVKDIIDDQPVIKNNPYVFAASHGQGPLNAWSQRKDEIDALLRKRIPKLRHWVHHDLRRTADTLMTAAGVSADHSERVLGHKIGGVRGVYNRWDYFNEKARALELLAEEVGKIVGHSKRKPVVPRVVLRKRLKTGRQGPQRQIAAGNR